MNNEIFDEIRRSFKIKLITSIRFKEVCGFTFVFKETINIVRNTISSAEIKPLGIIYSENGEYYFAPLENISNIEEIVKEYVRYMSD